jgi:CheY-like chemotaxis protein
MSTANAGFRILITDDERFSRGMVSRLLTSLGAQHIAFASSGAEARAEMIATPGLKMVISDHYMPGGSGLKLLADLRQGKLPLPHDTFFMIATASSSFTLTAVAMAFDCDAFLSKPFSKDELAKRMYAFLSDAPRTIKPSEHYAAIDADALVAAAERTDPAASNQTVPQRWQE